MDASTGEIVGDVSDAMHLRTLANKSVYECKNGIACDDALAELLSAFAVGGRDAAERKKREIVARYNAGC